MTAKNVVTKKKNPMGRPVGFDKAAMLAKMEERALTAVKTGRIRHPLNVMLDYMNSLDKADNLEAAAKFARELLPYFSSRMGLTTPPENKRQPPVEVTLNYGGSETVTIGMSPDLLEPPEEEEIIEAEVVSDSEAEPTI